jgi:hypothetical protein
MLATSQQLAPTAASIRVVLHHFVYGLNRQQLRAGSGMGRLAAAEPRWTHSSFARIFSPEWPQDALAVMKHVSCI